MATYILIAKYVFSKLKTFEEKTKNIYYNVLLIKNYIKKTLILKEININKIILMLTLKFHKIIFKKTVLT